MSSVALGARFSELAILACLPPESGAPCAHVTSLPRSGFDFTLPPRPWFFHHLRAPRFNRWATLHQIGLGDGRPREVQLKLTPGMANASSHASSRPEIMLAQTQSLRQMAAAFRLQRCCDVLKVDVEGEELYSLVDGPQAADNLAFIRSNVTQLQLELHVTDVRRARALGDALDAIGLKPFRKESNPNVETKCAEIAYINVRKIRAERQRDE